MTDHPNAPTETEVQDALRILEEILSMPSVKENDSRVKRRIRVEIRNLLSREEA